MVHNRIMKDEKLIIGLSNSLFGREKNSRKYGRDAFRFYHPGSLGRRRAQRPGGVAARAVCLVHRTMQHGAAGPATSAAPPAAPRHVSPVLRRHAWRGIGIWPRQGNRRGQKC